MSATSTRDDAAELLDALRGALAAIDAGQPVQKVMLEPAVAIAEQLHAAADRTSPRSAMAAMVAQFHEHPHSTGRAATVALTPALHAEEHDELLEAIELDDPPAIARELADVAYLAFSEAWARDLDLDAAFVEVHRAAMDKIAAGGRDRVGKLVKPPGFRAPDMAAATVWPRPRGAPRRRRPRDRRRCARVVGVARPI